MEKDVIKNAVNIRLFGMVDIFGNIQEDIVYVHTVSVHNCFVFSSSSCSFFQLFFLVHRLVDLDELITS
jgi:hypothetical protein